ncbi:MAG TPA: hypothetical protein VMM27_02345 [Casimicrobiaceae bacterium]|nr:hypothetical protein [Casimicrobiaceae bacterium]
MHELEDVLARREVPQAHGTQVAQGNVGRQARLDLVEDGLRQEHLASVRCLHDARGAVDGAAEEIVVAPLHDAQVQSGAHAKWDVIGCRELLQSLLQHRHRVEGIDGVGEVRVYPVPGHLDDGTPMLLDGLARKRVVLGERERHALPLLFPQAGAALNVGKHEGRVGGLWLHAGAPDWLLWRPL